MATLRDLSRAIVRGDLPFVRAHLAEGGSPDLNERGTSLLMEATNFKQAAIARALVEAKANVNAANQDGLTALSFALKYPEPLPAVMVTPMGMVGRASPPAPGRDPAVVLELVALLAEAGAVLSPALDDRADGFVRLMFRTPLQLAVEQGHPEVVAWLLERGADPNGGDHSGGTPLQEALFRHRTELVAPLLAAGARVDPPRWGMLARATSYANDQLGGYRYREKKAGREPDPSVLASLRSAWVDVLARLVAAGGDLARTDERGWTPLFDAVNGGDPVLLRKLVELGADLSHRVAGGTVLHFLAGLRRLPEPDLVPLAAVFAGTKADFAARNEQGKTAAEVARERGYAALEAALVAAAGG